MLSTKYLAPVLAVLGLAAAQSSTSLCAQPTATISSQGDASLLASCTTVQSIAIQSTVAGQLTLNGIQQIMGDLDCTGAVNLTQLSAPSVNSIGGNMNLNGLIIMSTLSFPMLSSVGNLNFQTLNALESLTFTNGITKAKSVLITDTALSTLSGINLQTVGDFEVTNNLQLRTINSQVANVTSAFTVAANGLALNLTLPDLIWANNMTVRNVSSISIPALVAVNTTLGIYSSSMSSIMAPNLTTVGGDLAIVDDSSLTNCSMPLLTTVGGGVLIANNSDYITINGFPLLSTTGAISVSGNYSDLELPALKDCKGSFNAQSSGNFSCTTFQASKGVVKGSFTCTPSSNNVQASGVSVGGSGSATMTGSAASSTSTKGAAFKHNPEFFGFSSLVGCLALLLM